MERTWNILYMVVTPEVFQLEISALKSFKSLKSPLISVTADTSQSAMRPYVVMAVCLLALYSWAAVLRSAMLVKT